MTNTKPDPTGRRPDLISMEGGETGGNLFKDRTMNVACAPDEPRWSDLRKERMAHTAWLEDGVGSQETARRISIGHRVFKITITLSRLGPPNRLIDREVKGESHSLSVWTSEGEPIVTWLSERMHP